MSAEPDFDGSVYESVKCDKHITHRSGSGPAVRSDFALPIRKPVWPDIWKDKGKTLIYHMRNESKCLQQPVSARDTVLRFNSRFESGNLMAAYRLYGDNYHLILENDRNGSGSCQWFYFQIKNVQRNIKYTFYISGFHKNNGVFATGSKVFMYSEEAARRESMTWTRTGTRYAYGVTVKGTGKGEKRSTLQFQIEFPYDNDTVYLCYAIPYTYSDLMSNIVKWKKLAPAHITSSTLCRTLGGRECPILTITSQKGTPMSEKSCIFMTGRVHPGESNGSIILHGVIDFLLSPNSLARHLLDKCVIYIVPMINIDGVIEGFYRAGLGGDDLNRVWSDPSKERHPVVWHTKKLIESIAGERHISAYIDFHGHSRQHGTFAYGCPNDDDPILMDSEKKLPRIISTLTDGFTWSKCVFSYPNARKDASRIVLRRELGIVHSFTIESSFGGITSGPRSGVLYDERIWKEIGGRIGESLYYLISGSLPKLDTGTPSEPKPKAPAMRKASARDGMMYRSAVKPVPQQVMQSVKTLGSCRAKGKGAICAKVHRVYAGVHS